MLIKFAFQDLAVDLDLHFVNDGEELLQYLCKTTQKFGASRPDLIILDLNMPKINGRQVLSKMHQQSDYQEMDIVVLSTSQADADIAFCKAHGVHSYYSKPDNYNSLFDIIKTLVLR